MSAGPPSQTPLLVLRGVTKRFTGVTALDQVDFDLHRGEIHALLGENGAGKSTLIKVLGGIHVPESGSIAIDGQPARIRSVADADRHGIRVIHQELSLAGNLSVAENVYLGSEPHCLGWLRRGKMHDDAAALVQSLGLDEIRDVGRTVRDLSVAEQQLVEIARALSAQARILVLDEPTSALSESESEALFATLRRLRSQGVGIIYISHRLEEVLRLADRVTVLRDGRSIGTQPAAAVNQAELIRWMVGRDIREHFHRPPHPEGTRPGEVALEVCDLWGPKTFGASFTLRYGEVLGIAGLVGSGRTELARALFGIEPIRRGRILLDGRPVSIRSPRDALACGIVLVPEDRKRDGLVMMQSLAFNLALPWVDQWIASWWPSWRTRRQIVDRAIGDFRIRTADPDYPVSVLSGGNQQKALVARWMHRRPKILVLDEPTRGVDVGAREEMSGLIGSLVESGMAVLLISSDLSEVMQTSHRILLYRDGSIVGTASSGEMTPEAVMTQLTGALTDETG